MSNLSWQDESLCKDMDPDIFFGTTDNMSEKEEAIAKNICSQCPVRLQCLDYAVTGNIGWGVWGATSVADRRKLRRSWVRDRRGQVNQAAQERASQARRLAEQGYRPEFIAGSLGVHVRTAQRLTSPSRVSVSA